MPYPDSPQWHDGRFRNPPGWPERVSFARLLRWWLEEGPRGTPAYTPPRVDNDGSRLREDRRTPSVTWIGHATLLVQAGGFSVLTDPMFSARLGANRRLSPPGLTPTHLPPIDLCVISHDHRDHLDMPSVRALGPEPTFVVPLGIGPLLRRQGVRQVIELDWWQSASVRGRAGAHAEVTLVPAQHYSQRGLFDENRTLWGGIHLALPGAEAYFAGDSGYPAAFAEIGRRFPAIDYALLPIGSYGPRHLMAPQHMDPQDAARAFGELGARRLVPMHWGTFRMTAEPPDEPPRQLREALSATPERLLLLDIGETFWQENPDDA